MRQPTVFVVEDDTVTRKAMMALLNAASLTYAAYDSAQAFLDDYDTDAPGCLLLDMLLPGMSGLDLIEQLRAQTSLLPILILSGTCTISMAVQAIKLGAMEVLQKPIDPAVLIPMVRAAIELDALRRSDANLHAELRQRLVKLTAREKELLRLLVDGASNKSIAAALGISVKTVENHRAHIMRKTGASNAADLVRISLRS